MYFLHCQFLARKPTFFTLLQSSSFGVFFLLMVVYSALSLFTRRLNFCQDLPDFCDIFEFYLTYNDDIICICHFWWYISSSFRRPLISLKAASKYTMNSAGLKLFPCGVLTFTEIGISKITAENAEISQIISLVQIRLAIPILIHNRDKRKDPIWSLWGYKKTVHLSRKSIQSAIFQDISHYISSYHELMQNIQSTKLYWNVQCVFSDENELIVNYLIIYFPVTNRFSKNEYCTFNTNWNASVHIDCFGNIYNYINI